MGIDEPKKRRFLWRTTAFVLPVASIYFADASIYSVPGYPAHGWPQNALVVLGLLLGIGCIAQVRGPSWKWNLLFLVAYLVIVFVMMLTVDLETGCRLGGDCL